MDRSNETPRLVLDSANIVRAEVVVDLLGFKSLEVRCGSLQATFNEIGARYVRVCIGDEIELIPVEIKKRDICPTACPN